MRRPGTRLVAVGLLLVALVLAGVVSRYASDDPDGLAKVSQDHGFAATGEQRDSVVGGYGSLTGVLGVLVVLGAAGGLTWLVRRRGREDERSGRREDERV